MTDHQATPELQAAGLIVAAGTTALSVRRNASPIARQIARDLLAAVGDKARAAGIPATALDVLASRCAGHDLAGAMRDAERIAAAIGPAAVVAIFNPPTPNPGA
jgi:hypothetical protein